MNFYLYLKGICVIYEKYKEAVINGWREARELKREKGRAGADVVYKLGCFEILLVKIFLKIYLCRKLYLDTFNIGF